MALPSSAHAPRECRCLQTLAVTRGKWSGEIHFRSAHGTPGETCCVTGGAFDVAQHATSTRTVAKPGMRKHEAIRAHHALRNVKGGP